MLENRYDFVMLFDVENGNPNGDPDAGNTPRVDVETGHGIISDVCLKRKIRNYVQLVKEGIPGYNILIKPDKFLNTKFTEVYEELGLTMNQKGEKADDVQKAREYMCRNYYDVRAFGAVMSTGSDRCGIVRGPVQINFAKSISPVNIQDISITRQARTKPEPGKNADTPEMARKSIIPYGLYRAEGYVSAALANKTDLSEEDLALLWQAIFNMFENDHSAARGKMCMRQIYIFKHDNVLGSCPSNVLFDKIKVRLKDDVEIPRAFSDYEITFDEAELPKEVTVQLIQ